MQSGTTAGTALSVRAMAAQLGVAKSQVQRDKAASMPMTSASEARAWRQAHKDLSRSADGRIDRPQRTKAAPPAQDAPAVAAIDAPGPAEDDHTQAFRKDRARVERVKADRAELELERLRGKLIDADDAARQAFTAFRVVRDSFENVSQRVACVVHAIAAGGGSARDIEACIATEIRMQLESGADTIARLAVGSEVLDPDDD